jgi:hypothetical protein
MISSPDQARPADTRSLQKPAKQYTGEVVYLYAFDVAYDMTRKPLLELFGVPVAQFAVDASKRSPRHLFFYKPQMVRLPPLERIGPNGPVRMERVVKILPVGAVSISIHVPFAVDRVRDLVDFHDLEFNNGILQDEVRQLAEEIRRELTPFLIRPVAQLVQEEAYTVFCIHSPLKTAEGEALSAESWLHSQRREVAALLTQEPDIDHLSNQEADESTGRYLSYYEHDLVVVDWDAALIVDTPENLDETLYVMELANVQLAELEAYDRLLDTALERSYRDLGESRVRNRGDVLRELRDIRIDLARFNDELSNITKFFGDWHLARVYENISARFHLGDWHRSINGKLKTLDDLYQLLKHDLNNRWMLILELTIVFLFIIDLVIVFAGLKK